VRLVGIEIDCIEISLANGVFGCTVTLIGFMALIVNFITICVYLPHFTGTAPSWVYLAASLGIRMSNAPNARTQCNQSNFIKQPNAHQRHATCKPIKQASREIRSINALCDGLVDAAGEWHCCHIVIAFGVCRVVFVVGQSRWPAGTSYTNIVSFGRIV
jgi:hypothetical protein